MSNTITDHSKPEIIFADFDRVLRPGLALIVTAAGATAPLLPLTSGRLFDASVGSPFGFNLDVLLRGGAPPFTWDVAAGSVLPAGLSLQAGPNGAPSFLSGVATTSGTYSYLLVVSDAAGQTLTIPITQNVSAVAVQPDPLPAGTVGTPYSVSLAASGTTPPYAIRLSSPLCGRGNLGRTIPAVHSLNMSRGGANAPNSFGFCSNAHARTLSHRSVR